MYFAYIEESPNPYAGFRLCQLMAEGRNTWLVGNLLRAELLVRKV